MLNEIRLIGRSGKRPALRGPLVEFSLYVPARTPGEGQWFDITAAADTFSMLTEWVEKGALLYVAGAMRRTRTITLVDGRQTLAWHVIASHICLLQNVKHRHIGKSIREPSQADAFDLQEASQLPDRGQGTPAPPSDPGASLEAATQASFNPCYGIHDLGPNGKCLRCGDRPHA